MSGRSVFALSLLSSPPFHPFFIGKMCTLPEENVLQMVRFTQAKTDFESSSRGRLVYLRKVYSTEMLLFFLSDVDQFLPTLLSLTLVPVRSCNEILGKTVLFYLQYNLVIQYPES